MPNGAAVYRKSLRDAVRALWTGSIDYDQFFESMTAAIRRRLPQAWYDGSKECGILPADLSPAERMALQQAVVNEMTFITKFANAIEAGSRARGGKLRPLLTRVELWAQRYTDLQSRARVMACGDKKLKWVRGDTVEPCRSCIRLGNKVKRASYWRRVNVYPQRPVNHSLECEGYNCLCQLLPTDERCSPGPLPRLP